MYLAQKKALNISEIWLYHFSIKRVKHSYIGINIEVWILCGVWHSLSLWNCSNKRISIEVSFKLRLKFFCYCTHPFYHSFHPVCLTYFDHDDFMPWKVFRNTCIFCDPEQVWTKSRVAKRFMWRHCDRLIYFHHYLTSYAHLDKHGTSYFN